MRINRALNLVIPIEVESGKVFVHSVPISREVFETYFLVMAKAFSAIFSNGLGATAGPPVAYLMLKEVAGDDWEDVKKGLIGEIVRLSNVAVLGERGWESMGLHTAFERGIFDARDRAEIEGQLVFFTLVVCMHQRPVAAAIIEIANGLWRSEATALPFTDFLKLLPTSKPVENTGAPVRTSSVPV